MRKTRSASRRARLYRRESVTSSSDTSLCFARNRANTALEPERQTSPRRHSQQARQVCVFTGQRTREARALPLPFFCIARTAAPSSVNTKPSRVRRNSTCRVRFFKRAQPPAHCRLIVCPTCFAAAPSVPLREWRGRCGHHSTLNFVQSFLFESHAKTSIYMPYRMIEYERVNLFVQPKRNSSCPCRRSSLIATTVPLN